MEGPFEPAPSIVTTSRDGTRIAVFATVASPHAEPDAASSSRPRRPLLLVHGTGSDHTTWRVAGPRLAASRTVWAMDRRGRGASTDGARYAAAREVEDVTAVAEALAGRDGTRVAILGHSLGGRLALSASRLTDAIDRVVAYESAPAGLDDAGTRDEEGLLSTLQRELTAGRPDEVLARFLIEVAGLPPAELEAFRASPLWPDRVATAPTIVRELDAALHDPAIGLEGLAGVVIPVLQLTGTVSPRAFRDGARALDARLAHGELAAIEGAGHAAHHSHADALVRAVVPFLDRVDGGTRRSAGLPSGHD